MAGLFRCGGAVRIRDVSTLVVMAALLLPFGVHAQEQCTQYVAVIGGSQNFIEVTEAVGETEEAACAAIATAWEYPEDALRTFEIRNARRTGNLTCRVEVWAIPKNSDPEFLNAQPSITLQSRLGDCPGCDEASVGKRFFKQYSYGSPPSDTCSDGCAATRSASVDACIGGTCVTEFTVTSEQCSIGGGGDPGPIVEEGEGEVCVGEFCTSNPGKEACGFVNDNYVCVGRTPADGCQALADGSRVCGDRAPTPPVPDNGTPGVPASPDGQIQTVQGDTITTTYNYYGAGTVGGSARDPGPGANPAGPGDGDGGEGSDGLHCDPESDPGCSEDGEGGTGEGEDPRNGWQCWADGAGLSDAVADCFASAGQGLWNTLVAESSLLQVATDTAAAFTAGSGVCPSGDVSLDWIGLSVDFWEVPCQFLDQFASFMGPLFLLMWSLIGLRILLTIPGGE